MIKKYKLIKNYFERKSKAAIIPPDLKGMPDCFKPISTPARVPASIRSLKSPRCPIRNTFPFTLASPVPRDIS